MPIHECTCSQCNTVWRKTKTLLATPVAGKHAGCCLQMRIRKNIVFAGFGHKLKAKISPASWTRDLHDGVIYAFSRRYGFATLEAPFLIDVERVLGSAFVPVDQGILVASNEVLIPKISDRMAGVRIGVDQHGEDVVVWIICSRDGARRLKASLPSYERRVHAPVPDEAV